MKSSQTYKKIDRIFRQAYGPLVTALLDRFGMNEFDIIENAVMEAFYKALKVWPLKEIPENPQGWLFKVSFNQVLDHIRKANRHAAHHKILAKEEMSQNEEYDDNSIKDPELRLLFIICHSKLRPDDQLAFMLKILSGFGTREIAMALLQKEQTVKKRLSRARSFIKENDLEFKWPVPGEISQRRVMVHKALYLLFNEGYYSSHPQKWVQKDFCLEAMRLCKYLCDHPLGSSDSHALMSLMCYHISRFESRTDDSDNLIMLKNQDRNQWDPYFIRLGHYYLEKSTRMTTEKTEYQIEAFISAQHCLATSFEKTDWSMLDVLYTNLFKLKKTHLVLMNLIVVKMHRGDLDSAREDFEKIDPESLKTYRSTYFLIGAELYKLLSDKYQSKLWLEKAIKNAKSKKETQMILDRFKQDNIEN